MNIRWLFVLLVVLVFTRPSFADEPFKFSPDTGKLKRGSSIRTTLYSPPSDKAITITRIDVIDAHGFDVEPMTFKGPPTDGVSGLTFAISRPFFSGFGGPRAGNNTIDFVVNYTVAGNTQPQTARISYRFVYTTAGFIYFVCGLLGLLLGYVVKSIITKQNEKNTDGIPVGGTYMNYMFVKNRWRLIIILVLGLAALIYVDLQSDSVYGWAQSLLLGLGLGLMGDETLVQKIQGTVKMGT